MKIKRIVVKELFGIFDHEIPLKMDDHITIIHGPNGYGKTILLTLVNALFRSQYSKLRRIPFGELTVEFDDGHSLRLIKSSSVSDTPGKGKSGEQLTLEFFKGRSKPKSYQIKPLEIERFSIPSRFISDSVHGLERIGPESWLYLPTKEEFSFEELLVRFGDRLPISFGSSLFREKKSEPDWLKEIKKSLRIHFIETQRLLNVSSALYRKEKEESSPMVPTVINYSEELAKKIQSKLAEYGSLSQSLDSTFPSRLVKGKPFKERTVEELKRELKELEDKRSGLIKAGILDKEKEIRELQDQDIEERNINVLSVYIEDVKEKLGVFDDLNARIDLLLKMINSRFLYKVLSINKIEGFVFTTKDRKKLAPTDLSSGEQHELVMFYEMLFKVERESLILIDEPELSLHVIWQLSFLEDLEKVTHIAGFDVLIATHSPGIINNRWDLTVELEAPKP